MYLWSCTDGYGQTSAGCVRAPHMMKLGDLAGSDAERRTLGRCSARRVVGLVGFGGLWTAHRAQKLAQGPGRRGRPVRSGGTTRRELGAHPGPTGGTTGGRLMGSVSSGRLISRVESVPGQIRAIHSAEIPQRSPGAMAVDECVRRGGLCLALCGPIVGAHAADLGACKCAPTF